ncbi:DarT ssDNA thymidine ADP-ribosyltransferase family protein [Bacillus thuringiensis]|uniref:DarT ssDNA thymidine ADP-ribosyltransferase family protein n=1 Tax=Bacillus thuringiensis TaxID=1428 RepID=UPI0015969799|nr:DarT ssDNA thymidine ADP-ribosyltransferase family protein [Bacillus thuringiensis]
MHNHGVHIKYSDIIAANTTFLSTNLKYLTQYAYHFSNITNVANILKEGKLYCRNSKKLEGKNVHDNASPEVIHCTDEEIKDYVRFYFRPKTPTQYHNEGIRSKTQINEHLHAHCPVPVFLVFDIDQILNKPNAYFTHESLASHHHVEVYNSYTDLEAAPFSYIYHFDPISQEERDMVVKARHAEILVKNECDLSSLKYIYCRNQAEADTLKSLLPAKIRLQYNDIITVPTNKYHFFFNNYTQIDNVSFDANNDLIIKWATSQSANFHFKMEVISQHSSNPICHGNNPEYDPHKFFKQSNRWFTGSLLHGYSGCIVTISLDDHLVYRNSFNLTNT